VQVWQNKDGTHSLATTGILRAYLKPSVWEERGTVIRMQT